MSRGSTRDESNSPLRVLHVAPSLDPKFGGPGWSVTSLCRALTGDGVEVTLAALDLTGGKEGTTVSAGFGVDVPLFRGWHLKRLGAVVAPGLRSGLRELADRRGVDVIHDHGLWLQTNRDASLVARDLGVPLVAAPRGTLEPWPRRQKKWKKQLAWRLYQRRTLERAGLLHATSTMEACSFRQLGLEHPIAVLPNAVDPEDFSFAPSSGSKEVLFLSRFHPKKGLLNLVRAWSDVRPRGWIVRLAGPDEGEHRSEVEAAVRRYGLDEEFEFSGPVYGEVKARLLARADLFVLPTKSENFGIVVAEALASGTPVITTRAAPWSDLEDHGCGWWVEVGVKPLARALEEATGRASDELSEMGRRGRRLVERRYNWAQVARQTLEVYRWLSGNRTRPDCVVPAGVEP